MVTAVLLLARLTEVALVDDEASFTVQISVAAPSREPVEQYTVLTAGDCAAATPPPNRAASEEHNNTVNKILLQWLSRWTCVRRCSDRQSFFDGDVLSFEIAEPRAEAMKT